MKLPLLLITLALANSVAGQEECCSNYKVSSDDGNTLAGDYTLKTKQPDKPEAVCNDGCIYTKVGDQNDEYCFKMETVVGITTECQSGSTQTSQSTISTPVQVSFKDISDDAKQIQTLANGVTDDTLKKDLLAFADLLTKISAILESLQKLGSRAKRQANPECSQDYCSLVVNLLKNIEESLKEVDKFLSMELPDELKNLLEEIKSYMEKLKQEYEVEKQRCNCESLSTETANSESGTTPGTPSVTDMTTKKTPLNGAFQMRKRGAAGWL